MPLGRRFKDVPGAVNEPSQHTQLDATHKCQDLKQRRENISDILT